jgi:hypothetical protein
MSSSNVFPTAFIIKEIFIHFSHVLKNYFYSIFIAGRIRFNSKFAVIPSTVTEVPSGKAISFLFFYIMFYHFCLVLDRKALDTLAAKAYV